MIFIAHRGNLDGKKTDLENHPDYITSALIEGFDVEIDVWSINNRLYLGHDNPQHPISIDFLKNERLWCHAKNLEALETLLENNCHTFSHDKDDYILTSKKIIWAYPGQPLTKETVCVMPETASYTQKDLATCRGICSDNIREYRAMFSKQKTL